MRIAVLFGILIPVLGVHSRAPAPVPKPRPTDSPLKLELQDSPLAVKFVNVGKEAIRILKPIDGSEWCWVMPYYKLTVINERDGEVRYTGRCGHYGSAYSDTKWPDDYLVVLKPGGSYTHWLRLNHDIREAGRYRLRFEYLFVPKSGGIVDGPHPPGVWRGSAVSNMIETELTPRD